MDMSSLVLDRGFGDGTESLVSSSTGLVYQARYMDLETHERPWSR